MDVTLDDLEVIATLGVGGFGRVELVKVMITLMMIMMIVIIMIIVMVVVIMMIVIRSQMYHCSVGTDRAQPLL